MKLIIKQIRVVDPYSSHHQQEVNMLIEKGIIQKITSEEINADNVEIIDRRGLCISPGFTDMRAFIPDPGYEYRDDLQSGVLAALAGGFTDLALLPNTNPVVQTKNSLAYTTAGNAVRMVDLHPMGAVTLDTEGEALTDMMDLHHAGAIAFTDGLKSLWNADILLKSLQYLQPFNGLLINRAVDKTLNLFGQMHEGLQSTQLGMKGMPGFSEALAIKRDLTLLEYAGGRLHFTNISTAAGLQLIRVAKKNGLQVSCDIAAHQLAFTDADLATFDTNFKVDPPFRSEEDIIALLKGVADGTIDAITSSHLPLDQESKHMEFDLADFGIIGLSTVFAVANTYKKDVSLDQLIIAMTHKPRQLLNLDPIKVQEGEQARLCLYHPEEEFILTKEQNHSKSFNSPFFDKTLKGTIHAVVNKGAYKIIAS